MTDFSILKKASDTIVSKGTVISFTIRPTSKWHEFKQKIGLAKVKAFYYMKPITMGSLIRISKLLLDIDIEGLKEKSTINDIYKVIYSHTEKMAEIIAIALHGMPSEVPESLKQTVLNNFSPEEMQGTLPIILEKMNIENFLISIISIKGRMNLMETSPTEQRETIAPGDLSAVL